MTTAIARIQNEIDQINLPYIRSIEHRENPLEVDIRFNGPRGTKYLLTEFHILLTYTEQYPFRPPSLTFVNQTHHGIHTNVSPFSTKLKLLKPTVWQVAYRLQDIMEGIQYMMKIEE
jgi:ubiquitin-protein ligase